MTELLVKLFVKDSGDTENGDVHRSYGVLAGTVGIICNVFLFIIKLVMGTLSGSVSVTADAVNNLSDASSSVITLLGFYIAGKPADRGHPFGHARMEYISGLCVAAVILIIGVQMVINSVEKIASPEPVNFTWVLAAVLLISIGLKLWLAFFYRKLGKKISSSSLEASAADSRNDVISTFAVLLAAVIEWLTGFALDGYIGLIVAVFILWSGIGIARDTINPILGRPSQAGLAEKIESEILGFDSRILGVHDLVIHDYGPGSTFASIHIEADSREDVLKTHEMLDNVEKMIDKKYNIKLVTHYDPVVTGDSETEFLRGFVLETVREFDPELKLHDFRVLRDGDKTRILFDLSVTDSTAGMEDYIEKKLNARLRAENEGCSAEITFDEQKFNEDD